MDIGFARNIGITTSFQAKLWALRDGLSLFVDRNFMSPLVFAAPSLCNYNTETVYLCAYCLAM